MGSVATRRGIVIKPSISNVASMGVKSFVKFSSVRATAGSVGRDAVRTLTMDVGSTIAALGSAPKSRKEGR
jgi:hypothetical protein